jgi:hypothetical protein
MTKIVFPVQGSSVSYVLIALRPLISPAHPMHNKARGTCMRKLNYFGQSFSKLRIGGFILASLGSGAIAQANQTEEKPERKREVTLSVKAENMQNNDLSSNDAKQPDSK